MTSVNDEVFSKLVLGDGIAIKPSEGKVYSPTDATVAVSYPTGHAIGLIGSMGEEILIHIGINTVELNGKYFTSYVKPDMKVKKGDLLVEFDLETIQQAGYDPTIMVIVTKTDHLKEVQPLVMGNVNMDSKVMNVTMV